MAAEVGVVLAVLGDGAGAEAVGEGGFEGVVIGSGDVAEAVDGDAGDVLALVSRHGAGF